MAICLTSTDIALAELECNLDAGLSSGIYCLGPSDPWDMVGSVNADPVVYWLPASVFESAPCDARETLRAQVSSCPPWAFDALTYTVHYLVHCLL